MKVYTRNHDWGSVTVIDPSGGKRSPLQRLNDIDIDKADADDLFALYEEIDTMDDSGTKREALARLEKRLLS